ncbi:MAG: TSUP family transporter [Pseudomonadales bacterium]
MELGGIGVFLFIVAMAAVIQTVTGFAMGLIIVALTTALGLLPILESAAIISILSMVNTVLVLQSTPQRFDPRLFGWVVLGLVPSLIMGFLLLDAFSAVLESALKIVLGVMVIVAGVVMMLSPEPWSERSSNGSALAVGFLGGFFGGIYSAAGAPIAFFLYRQPVAVAVIRLTLLAVFFVSTFSRAVIGAYFDHFTEAVVLKTALALPVVIIVSVVMQPTLARISDIFVRRLVFLILQAVGLWLIIEPWISA